MTECEAFQFGGGIVRIEWTSEKLRQALGPALSRRLVPAADPALTIRAVTGPADWAPPPDGGLIVSNDAAGLRVIDPVRRFAHWIDPTGARAGFHCEFPEELPVHERAAPFRLILQWWLQTRGLTMLHAGAVGLPGQGAVLLAARSGGGKSNTTLACLAGSPLHLLGEDYVAVSAVGAPRVWSLYNTAKLHAADLARFPQLAADVAPARDEADGKAMLQLAGRYAGRWADNLPLRAILVLKITGAAESQIRPAAPPEAVKEMLTSLLMVLPGMRRPLFEFVTRLAQSLPVFRLELGTNPGQTAALIHEFVARGQP